MIKEIAVKNFKLFREKVVFGDLKPINLLTGVNGRGKSSFLQLLLIPKQTILSDLQTKDLLLDGEYVRLGSSMDVKNVEARREETVDFTYKEADKVAHLYYNIDEAKKQILSFASVQLKEGEQVTAIDISSFYELCVQHGYSFDNIQYISAERIAPQLYYPVTERERYIGAKGEYTVSLLNTHKNDPVSEEYLELLIDLFPELNREELSSNLVDQIEFWMSKMFKKTTIQTQFVDEANVVTLKISTSQHINDRFKPTNVGFGYTYILPIVVAGLTAKSGDIIVVENPEAHLHPSAQAMIGRFLAVISKLGVQLFVESHSEHILNSFRVCIKQGHLRSNDLNVLFFEDDNPHYFRKVEIDHNGRIEEWPRYFYDQEEQDLDILTS